MSWSGIRGASAMSSNTLRLGGRILIKNPKALYVHNSSHLLNLMVPKARKLLT